MYGKRRYNQGKPVNPSDTPTKPNFVCTHCHLIKFQENGYQDLFLSGENKTTPLGRICNTCVILMKTWLKG